jgi:hypothetical protein
VDAHAVSDIALDEDAAPAHAVSEHVTGVPVHDDPAGVHRVAHAVLRVAEDLDGGPVHEHRQVLTGGAVDLDALVGTPDPGTDVALAVDVAQHDLRRHPRRSTSGWPR